MGSHSHRKGSTRAKFHVGRVTLTATTVAGSLASAAQGQKKSQIAKVLQCVQTSLSVHAHPRRYQEGAGARTCALAVGETAGTLFRAVSFVFKTKWLLKKTNST